MDLDGIIHELHAERNRLDRIIHALEEPSGGDRETRSGNRRGRKSMDAPAREEVSVRMKQYWAKKRGESGDSPDAT